MAVTEIQISVISFTPRCHADHYEQMTHPLCDRWIAVCFCFGEASLFSKWAIWQVKKLCDMPAAVKQISALVHSENYRFLYWVGPAHTPKTTIEYLTFLFKSNLKSGATGKTLSVFRCWSELLSQQVSDLLVERKHRKHAIRSDFCSGNVCKLAHIWLNTDTFA